MKKLFTLLVFIPALFILQSCWENNETNINGGGVYQGIAQKVKVDEKLIYVKIMGKELVQLYFTDSTKLTKNSIVVPFEEIKQNSKVIVQIEKVGEKIIPIKVVILTD